MDKQYIIAKLSKLDELQAAKQAAARALAATEQPRWLDSILGIAKNVAERAMAERVYASTIKDFDSYLSFLADCEGDLSGPSQVQAFRLKFVEGFSPKEAAEIMGYKDKASYFHLLDRVYANVNNRVMLMGQVF